MQHPILFDTLISIKYLQLQLIALLLHKCTKMEQNNYHSYIEEASTSIWAIEIFCPYLHGWLFAWIMKDDSFCKFFERGDLPTNIFHHWYLKLLSYKFSIIHCPAQIMAEVDLLSRYSGYVEEDLYEYIPPTI